MWVSGVGCFIFYALGLLIEFFIFGASQIFCIKLYMNNSNNNKKPRIIILVHHFWRLAWGIWWHVDRPAECAGAPRMWQPGQTSLRRGSPSSLRPGTGLLWPQDIMFPEKGKKDAWFSAETPSVGNTYFFEIFLCFEQRNLNLLASLPPNAHPTPNSAHPLKSPGRAFLVLLRLRWGPQALCWQSPQNRISQLPWSGPDLSLFASLLSYRRGTDTDGCGKCLWTWPSSFNSSSQGVWATQTPDPGSYSHRWWPQSKVLSIAAGWRMFLTTTNGASGKEPACQCRRSKRHEFDA